MKIGAIVTISGSAQPEGKRRQESVPDISPTVGGMPFARTEILGRSVLQRILDNLRKFGVEQPVALFEETGTQSLFPSKGPASGQFFSAWEGCVGDQLACGAEILLLMRVGGYLELNLGDLLDFHRQAPGVLTQVYDDKSAFEVAVVSTSHLRGDRGSFRGRLSSLIPYHRRYHFSGYSNRLREPQDLRRLVLDALHQRNSIRPIGVEVSPQVWMGEGAKVDGDARIVGPAFIGARSKVRAYCLVNGGSNIERDCEVDFRTAVTNSCIWPETYLGIGLNVVNSIAASNKLFNLDRNVEVEITDRSLMGKQRSIRTFTKLIGGQKFFSWSDRQPNGVETHL